MTYSNTNSEFKLLLKERYNILVPCARLDFKNQAQEPVEFGSYISGSKIKHLYF